MIPACSLKGLFPNLLKHSNPTCFSFRIKLAHTKVNNLALLARHQDEPNLDLDVLETLLQDFDDDNDTIENMEKNKKSHHEKQRSKSLKERSRNSLSTSRSYGVERISSLKG